MSAMAPMRTVLSGDLDALQVIAAIKEDHLRQVAQLLGDPEADIGGACDQRGLGAAFKKVSQFIGGMPAA